MAKRKRPKSKTKTQNPHKTIGILHSGTNGKHDREIAAFTDYLTKAGYSNITIVGPLWSDDDPQRLANNAQTLAAPNAGLDLIVAAGGTASVYALVDAQSKAGTNTNVVFTTFSEQNAPAPNMTGVNAQTSGLDVPRMQLLYNDAPNETTFGVLENPKRPNYDPSKLQAWADQKGVTLNRQPVYKNAGEADQAVIDRIDAAFDNWRQNKIKFAQVCADPIFNDHRPDVTKAANRPPHITTIYQWKEFGDDGATPSDLVYGTSLIEAYQQAGKMAGDVLNNPQGIAAIPVYTLMPQLFVKRKTAKGRRRKKRL